MRNVDAHGSIIGGGVNVEDGDTTVRVTDSYQLTVTEVETGDTTIKELPGFGEDTTGVSDKP